MKQRSPLTLTQRFMKRGFDILFSLLGLAMLWWLILLLIVAATYDTRQFGLFSQTRIGRHGRHFSLLKIRTMRHIPDVSTVVTTARDPRITAFGALLRRFKLDELPQLLNVLIGDMSIVGPRPDVPGFADRLEGDDRLILTIRPGITGPATLHYRNEEELLAAQSDPESYNRDVIYPTKVRLTREYIENYSLFLDIRCMIRTLTGAPQE
jgi:lipopolysaccharide/colanic/teichoic acid biosynthesis glycosyltransferase